MAMEFKKALQSNRSICLLLMIAILAGMLFGFKPLLSLEYKAYDLVANLRHRAAGTPVVIVAIDDKSLKNIGDWPWGLALAPLLHCRYHQYPFKKRCPHSGDFDFISQQGVE
jgi:CHASE2 domain-containing sensor protein